MKITSPQPAILSSNLFPVVGIGASAGGLDAFKKFLKAIPENSGMAYVLVQHLDPNHESLLSEILQKITKIPVVEIADDIMVTPNHIYVIPSNKMLVATDGILQLMPRPGKERSERNMPIDLFFNSLAEVHQTYAIGVVLSGTATDGTLGLGAIKDHGGVTFAQDEDSAAYGSMPHSAIAAGVVDYVLPPEQIPPKLMELAAKQKADSAKNFLHNNDTDELFKEIIALLRLRKGTDFTYYKQTTIRRRILHRMALMKVETGREYLRYLGENTQEQDLLYQDLLIPVTAFFRDQKTFDNLSAVVFPEILKTKPPGEAVRIWVAGCSTGQEAYSIAVCFKELPVNIQRNVQIFATDISEPAIAKARAGIYTKAELSSVSPHRLQEFFTRNNDNYQVNKPVRDMCVFAAHNFLKDPPFGKMDFISCRNVLIYMESYLQKKALTTFHYSLNAHGFLLLGKSETTACVPDFFTAAARNDKLFLRKEVPGRFPYVPNERSVNELSYTRAGTKSETTMNDFQKTADDIVLSKYAPAGVVVNENMDIVHFRGDTSIYLQQSPGKPSHNLLKMAKEGLGFELRNMLHKAKLAQATVIKENIPLTIHGSLQHISIEAMPLPNTIEPYFLVLFHNNFPNAKKNTGTGKKKPASGRDQDEDRKARIEQLEKELAQGREDMRSITEDQEAAYEELQSSNEELVSSSEELQSLNEELETNKEELQSTNEELTVVNQEVIGLNVQVTESLEYAQAIVATIHEPMIVLDKTLRVKSANASFYRNFRVTEEDTKGVLLYDLGTKQWDIPRLRELLEDIIPKKTQFQDFEITHNFPGIGIKIMLLNANLIVQKNTSEQLILLAIHDVTELRTKTKLLRIKEEELLNKDIAERKADKIRLENAIEERTKELEKVNGELVYQNQEKEKRAAELVIANRELVYQNEEKEKRAAELALANQQLVIQSQEREKRAAALVIANNELVFQNNEKEKRAAELVNINKELEAFTYVSSHDLQEPLRKIQTFANRILEKEYAPLSEKGKEYFHRMHDAAKRMQTLIEDLLAYSRTSLTDINFENTSLRTLIEEVVGDLAESIKAKNAIIEFGTLHHANISSLQFRQLVQNLIANALKFSKPGIAPHIIIKSEIGIAEQFSNTSLVPGASYCALSFTDNGIGFDPQYKEQIFEVFQRLHGRDEYAGTGVGLAIVKKIVEKHSGIITAESGPGKGARFDIYIPV